MGIRGVGGGGGGEGEEEEVEEEEVEEEEVEVEEDKERGGGRRGRGGAGRGGTGRGGERGGVLSVMAADVSHVFSQQRLWLQQTLRRRSTSTAKKTQGFSCFSEGNTSRGATTTLVILHHSVCNLPRKRLLAASCLKQMLCWTFHAGFVWRRSQKRGRPG